LGHKGGNKFIGPSISVGKILPFQPKCGSRVFPTQESIFPTIIFLMYILDGTLEEALEKRFGLEKPL
jgi:hypothetical protein